MNQILNYVISQYKKHNLLLELNVADDFGVYMQVGKSAAAKAKQKKNFK